MAPDPRILEPDELETIARRIAREPVYSSDTDCRQAFADRRALLGHLIGLERAGQDALAAIAGGGPLDLDAARRIARDRQDRAVDWPDA